MAALVNGATSHALDFDDTHFAHVGHLSVGIFPAALAVAEEIAAPASAVVEALLVGAEAAIRIGSILGSDRPGDQVQLCLAGRNDPARR